MLKVITSKRYYQGYLVGILLLSLLLNLSYINWGLPGSWHPDEIGSRSMYLFADRTLNPHFFSYPSLHIYLIALVNIVPLCLFVILLNIINGYSFLHNIYPDFHYTSQVYLLSRAFTAIMGTSTVLIVYLIANKIFNRNVALIAAAFLAITPGFISLSHFATVDIPSLFWMTLAFFICLMVLEKGSILRYSLAGLAVGLAASTKYTGILMIAPLIATFVISTNQAQPKHIRNYIVNRNLLIVALAVLGGFIIGTPYSIINFPKFIAGFIELNFYQGSYAGTGGPSFIPHIYNLLNIYGIAGGVVSLLGFLYATYLVLRYRDPRVLLLIITIAVIYLKMGSITFHPYRYIILIVPFLTICASKLIHDLIVRNTISAAPVKGLLVISLALGIAFTGIYTISGIAQIRNDDRNLAAAWLLENVPETATIEMTPLYGVNIPETYVNSATIPSYHLKETYTRMNSNDRYIRLKNTFKWIDWSEETPPLYQIGNDPGSLGLDALLSRKPEYLILAESWYGRFFSESTSARTDFPLQHNLYDSVLQGRTPYKIVADFRKKGNLLTPELEFINSGITILQYVGD